MRLARRAIVVFLWIAMNVAVAELAVRAFFAVKMGPRVFLYGTPWHRNVVSAADPLPRSVQSHHNDVGAYTGYALGATSYSKYFPGEEKWTESPDRKTGYRARINNHGFRGADFTVEKPPGTVRVLTLGASSTFGYHDRDDETYPVYLQQDLQRAVGDTPRFEVINFAIPHSTTDNMIAMLTAEGLALSPDVVTFYEGANDSALIEPREGKAVEGWRERMIRWSLLAAVVDRMVPQSEATDTAWWWSEELAHRRSRAFLANMNRLAAICREHGIRLIVATQQFKSTLIPEDHMHGLTYDQEVEVLRGMLARGEIGPKQPEAAQAVLKLRADGWEPLAVRLLTGLEPPRAMLVHAVVMNDLRAWAPQAGVGFVDVIHELDGNRDLLVNWVHLLPAANAMIANALAREILRELDLPSLPDQRELHDPRTAESRK